MSLATNNLTVDCSDITFLSKITTYPINQCKVNEPLKRFFDLIVASLLLILLFPLMAVIAFIIRFTSGEPVFYKQDRVGKNGKFFEIYKFRTMVNYAEKESGPVWSPINDSRITPVGRILRKMHLDELPQLINIIKGDMSLIGPRPERPFFVEKFKNKNILNYDMRHCIRGGITGYAQVLSPTPSIEHIEEKTLADIHYIQNWSIGLEIKIVLQTVFHIFNQMVQFLR